MPVGVAIIRALKAHLDTLAEAANKAGRSVQIVTGKCNFFLGYTHCPGAQVHELIYEKTTSGTIVKGVSASLPQYPGIKTEVLGRSTH